MQELEALARQCDAWSCERQPPLVVELQNGNGLTLESIVWRQVVLWSLAVAEAVARRLLWPAGTTSVRRVWRPDDLFDGDHARGYGSIGLGHHLFCCVQASCCLSSLLLLHHLAVPRGAAVFDDGALRSRVGLRTLVAVPAVAFEEVAAGGLKQRHSGKDRVVVHV